MATQLNDRFDSYIDSEIGTVDRAIFSDEEIYQREQAQIFARAWNFMCHESQIPKPGDFFLSYIGEESVIATRDKGGKLQVFLNSCRHRGNAVCRAESGHTRAFLCTYHGWTYGLDGKLMGVPGFHDLYHAKLDKDQWGLVSAGKVQSYRGFVFATMDPEAPELEEYLGEVGRLGLNFIAAQGDMVVVEGVQKNRIGCNWKIAVDNVFDWYHPDISHASAFMSGMLPRKEGDEADHELINPLQTKEYQRVILGEYGHAIGGPRMTEGVWNSVKRMASGEDPIVPMSTQMGLMWRLQPKGMEELGTVGMESLGHPNIFPNLWVGTGGTQLALRLPKGPNETELWWFTFVGKDWPAEIQAAMINRATKIFGPAGMLEQDDGENWEMSSDATRGPIGRKYPLNYQLDIGATKLTTPNDGPAYIDTHLSEHAQLWTYRAWADWMDADSWSDLKRDRALPQDVFKAAA